MDSHEYSIVYCDETLVGANKPAGMPTQADQSGDDSLERMIAKDLGGSILVVHRLDRPASGIVLFARQRPIAAQLSEMLKTHQVERVYWAIVNRSPREAEATLSQRISFDRKKNKSYVTSGRGKPAVLRYSTIAESERYSLLEVRLETGRHHQIRAQLSAVGSPIRGDLKYGAKRSQRGGGIGLHAVRVAFSHPQSGSRVDLFAPPPEDSLWSALTQSL